MDAANVWRGLAGIKVWAGASGPVGNVDLWRVWWWIATARPCILHGSLPTWKDNKWVERLDAMGRGVLWEVSPCRCYQEDYTAENFCVTKFLRNFGVQFVWCFQGFARVYVRLCLCSLAPWQRIWLIISIFPRKSQMLKWSFLICSVVVAFNGVQTRVLVDAPRKFSAK